MTGLTPQQSLDLALDYITLNPGRYIFPIAAGEKFPPTFKNNLVLASNNPTEIISWCAKWPGCNWGLSHKKSRMLVVDVDTKPGKNGQETFDRLDLEYTFPKTEMTRTPSGGYHLIYEGEHIFALGKSGFGDGIDSPNYTLLPGCKFSNGTEYVNEGNLNAASAPEWFYKVLGAAKVKKTDAGESAVEIDKPENIEWATLFLKEDAEPAIEGKNGDAQTLKIAMGVRDRGVSEAMCAALMIEFYNERCEPPWEVADLERKVANAYAYASQTKLGGKTGEADFADDDAEEAARSIKTLGDPKEIAKERRDRDKERQREANIPVDQKQRFLTKQEMLDTYVYVAAMDRFVNVTNSTEPWKRIVFDSMLKYLAKGKLSEALFAATKGSIRRFDNVGYVPGDGISLDGGKTCNLWRPSNVTPFEGDVTWWNEHLEYLFPDPVDREHLMNWLAWFYQNPKRKPKHALLLQGHRQGTGKSFIVDMLAAIIGEHNREVVSQTDLGGDFNGYGMRTKLITVEELRAVERSSVKNALHDIITQDYISINEKNMPKFKMRNCFGVIGMTNDDAAISLDKGDRRYLVLRTEAEPKDTQYYARLYAKLDDPKAVASIAFLLQNYNVGAYDGAGRAPNTKAKEEMIQAGLTELENWMIEHADQYPLCAKITTVNDVIDMLPPRLERHGRLSQAVCSALKTHFGAKLAGQFRAGSNGYRQRLYIINGSGFMNFEGWQDRISKAYEDDRAKGLKGGAQDFSSFGTDEGSAQEDFKED